MNDELAPIAGQADAWELQVSQNNIFSQCKSSIHRDIFSSIGIEIQYYLAEF
jgi:hypothetical protein